MPYSLINNFLGAAMETNQQMQALWGQLLLFKHLKCLPVVRVETPRAEIAKMHS